MVYGKYNYSFHGVYKPTNITGGHHPVLMFAFLLSMKIHENVAEILKKNHVKKYQWVKSYHGKM